ncbi:MAG: Maf family nucleotide pyrophosphatase [Alphaproteobacteria bacterium]|nr:Maf family nucleotide pyrophosphatase [Alphaproteobacteria bacterium]
MNKPILWLASASPQRASLLAQIGIVPDKICSADIDESPYENELPRQYAARMALTKARYIHQSHNKEKKAQLFILAADTVIATGRTILPKAQTRETAETCLTHLSARSHRVYGGICLLAGGREMVKIIITRVQMKRLAQNEITAYLASDEWQDKAGGYAIQGRAGRFVRAIHGSYSNIVGLPLYETAMLLQGAGYNIDERAHNSDK